MTERLSGKMIVGGYSLNLYCDNVNFHNSQHLSIWGGNYHFRDGSILANEFVGETFSECARHARKYGWKIDRKQGICVCPLCVKEKVEHEGL